MSKKILGLPFDIGGGGGDLMFPHHDGEIAQSEAGYGGRMVNYWMHNGMITVDGKKMGKSLGNFKNIEDLDFPPMAIRYFVVSNHYRRPLDFSKTALKDAQNSYERLKRLVLALEDDGEVNGEYLDEFRKEMDDDFNGPRAMAVLWKLVRDEGAEGKVGAVRAMDEVFGLELFKEPKTIWTIRLADSIGIEDSLRMEKIPEEVLKLLKKREIWRELIKILLKVMDCGT